MKKVFIPLFLITMSLAASSQDYYWYSGQQIPLERGCRQYIIYEDDLLQESDKAQIAYSEDVSYEGYINLKWGYTRPNAKIEDTAHVHYRSISYKKNGDYYDNMFVTHRFNVKLKSEGDLSLLQEMAAQNHTEIEKGDSISLWYNLRCQLDPPHNALELANMFYETGSFAYVEPEFSNAIELDPQPGIKSLCDEWNVLAMRNPNTSAQLLRFSHYYLTTDTMINGLHYVQVQLNDQYKGALREDDNANIYYVPADSTHEYLLYAFHAQVGDELENLWVSYTNLNKDAVSDLKVTISEIKPTTPKTIVVDVSFTLTSGEVREHFNRQFEWLDGIGNVGGPFFANLLNGPINSDSNGDLRGVALLCAYKNGEHVYTSEWGEKYGCEYNYDPYSTPTDTIPLYIKDGPGTSTVEPVDPNQIVATLVGDMLSIYEYIGAEIGYKVSKAPTGNNMPARGKEMADDTFSESVSIHLTESGLYTLELTNPEWDYTIVGTFEYGGMQGIEPAETGVPAAQKILRNGQLLIQKGDRIYTVQGIEIRE